jgi:hypothetical protein
MNESGLFLAAGKSLFICQHFEATCKDIVMWFCLSKALFENKFKFLSSDHIEYVDKLLKLLLGPSVKRLWNEFGDEFADNDIQVIENAREARNYICHQLIIPLVFADSQQGNSSIQVVDRLRQEVRNLAIGDYLVSRWAYEFFEKQSGSFMDKDSYVARLGAWVLNGYD